MGRRGYPAEFRWRVLELVEAGRKVGEVATDLGISEQTIYSCAVRTASTAVSRWG